ncbi:acyltransferase family protein [Enterobacter sp.]|uniref:acyltransferase family protein n=1 Tax=Enterobacter sp. TaxID=42895 RepID=UPI00296F4576|nr:acyltransferase family protein [Enterobacter sp.]
MEFRKDINGLRAIAVLSVIIFHYNKDWLPGGFVGVDVFFAISGFLMTSIIFNGIEKGNFSIISFIKRRAKRIIPPLIVVILLSIAFGYLVLEPITYQMAGKHGLYSLLFLSNHIYNGESGYFDAAAASKIFLHTWSLSVEWQFYIIYPIAVFILSKLTELKTIRAIAILCFFSFFLASVYYTKIEQSSAYFMLYSRAWEMIAGGLAFLFPLTASKISKKKIEYAGLFLIAFSCMIYTEKTPWPGHFALLTIFGAYLCLAANNKESILNMLPFQKIGTWSYSLYLVHWPILAIYRNIGFDFSVATYLAITFVFGFMSYWFVERNLKYWYCYLPVYVATAYACYLVSINGIDSRVDTRFQLSAFHYHKKYYGGSGFDSSGKVQLTNTIGSDAQFIISGDSYARQYLRYLKDADYKFISVMKDGCFASEHYLTKKDAITDAECSSRYNNLLKVLEKYPSKPLVIIQAWGDYADRLTPTSDNYAPVSAINYYEALDEELTKIFERGGNARHYYIVGANFTTNGNAVYECLAKTSMDNWFIRKFISSCDNMKTTIPTDINEKMRLISKKYTNVTFIDPNVTICKDGQCKSITNDREPVLSDGSHLSYFGSLLVGKSIFSLIK